MVVVGDVFDFGNMPFELRVHFNRRHLWNIICDLVDINSKDCVIFAEFVSTLWVTWSSPAMLFDVSNVLFMKMLA